MHTPPQVKFLVACLKSWRELITLIIGLLALYWVMDWVEYMNRPVETEDGTLAPSKWGFLYELAKYAQVVVAAFLAVSFPWLMMAMTLPKTYGAFAHSDLFDKAWTCVGADKMTMECWQQVRYPITGIVHGNAIHLACQLRRVMTVYFAYLAVLVLSWIATK